MRSVRRKKMHTLFFNNSKVKVRLVTLLFSLFVLVFGAITYPIGLDPNADIFGLYADKDAGITRNVIIDKDGKIIMLTRLYDPQEFAQMTELINEILK